MNSQPSGHEPPPITTRPGLPPCCSVMVNFTFYRLLVSAILFGRKKLKYHGSDVPNLST